MVTGRITFTKAKQEGVKYAQELTAELARQMNNYGWTLLQARVRANTNQEDAPASVYMLGNRTKKLYRRTGLLDRSMVRGKPGNVYELRALPAGIAVTYGFNLSVVPYARIHEYGGTFQQSVTPKQRAYFFSQYKRTGQERWLGMALSKTLSITIPARPFLRAGIQEFLEKDAQLVVDLATGALSS